MITPAKPSAATANVCTGCRRLRMAICGRQSNSQDTFRQGFDGGRRTSIGLFDLAKYRSAAGSRDRARSRQRRQSRKRWRRKGVVCVNRGDRRTAARETKLGMSADNPAPKLEPDGFSNRVGSGGTRRHGEEAETRSKPHVSQLAGTGRDAARRISRPPLIRGRNARLACRDIRASVATGPTAPPAVSRLSAVRLGHRPAVCREEAAKLPRDRTGSNLGGWGHWQFRGRLHGDNRPPGEKCPLSAVSPRSSPPMWQAIRA